MPAKDAIPGHDRGRLSTQWQSAAHLGNQSMLTQTSRVAFRMPDCRHGNIHQFGVRAS